MITNFAILETNLTNISFLLLLIGTIYYWFEIFLFSKNSLPTIEVNNSTSFYKQEGIAPKIGFFCLSSVTFLITLQLINRWVQSGHFPLSGLYESLLFLSWSLLVIYLYIEYELKTEIFGTLLAPLILCITTFTGFSLPPDLQQNKPLVPALQSNWLFMHVSVMMLSYGALLFGSVIALGYIMLYFFLQNKNEADKATQNSFFTRQIINLLKNSREKTIKNQERIDSNLIRTKQDIESLTFIESNYVLNNYEYPDKTLKKLNQSLYDVYSDFFEVLDNLSYRTIGIGFCFLTLGILSGAVWANETWGSYWSWDPKETWALITWLIFAIYLHTRFLQNWKGLKPAWIASFGFFIIWICYLGVNLLGKGLHSYGFFTN